MALARGPRGPPASLSSVNLAGGPEDCRVSSALDVNRNSNRAGKEEAQFPRFASAARWRSRASGLRESSHKTRMLLACMYRTLRVVYVKTRGRAHVNQSPIRRPPPRTDYRGRACIPSAPPQNFRISPSSPSSRRRSAPREFVRSVGGLRFRHVFSDRRRNGLDLHN